MISALTRIFDSPKPPPSNEAADQLPTDVRAAASGNGPKKIQPPTSDQNTRPWTSDRRIEVALIRHQMPVEASRTAATAAVSSATVGALRAIAGACVATCFGGVQTVAVP